MTVREQLALPGLEPPPAPTDRLFYAVFPPADIAARIARLAPALKDTYGLKGKPSSEARLHVTLQHLGDHAGLPADLVEAARAAAASVEMARFETTFDRVSAFSGRPRNLPIVLRDDARDPGLTALHDALGHELDRLGWALRPASFKPHVTLMYGDRRVPEHPVEPLGWTVSEFALVHSLLGKTRYEILGRWPLR